MPGAVAKVALGVALLTPIGTSTAVLTAIVYGVSAALWTLLAIGSAALARTLTPTLSQKGSQTLSENSRDAVWKIRYGEFEGGGAITYHTTLHDQEILNICEVYAPHPVEGIIGYHLNDKWVYPTMLDSNGYVTEGHWGPPSRNEQQFRVESELGTKTDTSQWPPFFAGPYGDDAAQELSELPAEWTDLTEIHGNGLTKAWYRWKFQPELYPNGVPRRSMFARWKNDITDTRDSIQRYTNNPALILKDYSERIQAEGGAGFITGVLTDANITTEANVCDEEVEVSGAVMDVGLGVAADDTVILSKDSQPRLLCQTGDGLEFTEGTTLPGGVSASPTRYYAIVVQVQNGYEGSEDSTWLIKLATTYANALAGTAIDITTAGTGDHTVQVKSHPRYTFNGQLDSSAPVRQNIKLILNSMGANLYPIGGTAVLKAAAWRAPVLTFDEGDLRGDLRIVQTRHSQEDRFNAVRGDYIDQQFYGQTVSYKPITSSVYEANDNGTRIYDNQDYQAVSSMDQARRLASIHLQRHRFGEKIVQFLFKPVAHQLMPGDTFNFDFAPMEWVAEVFEVVDFDLILNDQSGEMIGVTITGMSTSADVFNVPAEFVEAFPEQDSPVTAKTPPSGLLVTETLINYKDQQIIQVRMDWTKPTQGYVDHYETQYKLTTDAWDTADVNELPDSGNVYTLINDVAPGLYDWRVRAVDNHNKQSSWVEVPQEIYGFDDIPADITNLALMPFYGMVMATWMASTESDVIKGGNVLIRHDSIDAGSSPDWSNTVPIGSDRGESPGGSSVTVLPKRAGWYMFKFRDASGQLSANAISEYLAIDETGFTVDATVTEDPTFAGVKDDCNVAASTLTMDTIGGVSIEPDATYTFNNAMNLGSVKRVRVLPNLTVAVFLEYPPIDSRLENIDDWLDFDGSDGSEADARVWFRTTQTDPTGSPTWTSFSRLDAAIVDAWGLEFKLEMNSYDGQTNIDVTALSCTAETIP